MKKLSLFILHAFIFVSACVQLIALLYLFNGSFEVFPTEEGQGAVRITCGIVIFALFMVEFLLWKLIRRIKY